MGPLQADTVPQQQVADCGGNRRQKRWHNLWRAANVVAVIVLTVSGALLGVLARYYVSELLKPSSGTQAGTRDHVHIGADSSCPTTTKEIAHAPSNEPPQFSPRTFADVGEFVDNYGVNYFVPNQSLHIQTSSQEALDFFSPPLDTFTARYVKSRASSIIYYTGGVSFLVSVVK